MEHIVLETGLGGRLDATNAVDRKTLRVITSIGYDHMEYLGNTLPEIALEKAGIMRKGIPAVCSVRQPEAARAIEQYACNVGAKYIPVSDTAIKDINIKNKTIDFSFHINYDDYIRFTVSSSALYQVENAACALKALECLADRRITAAHNADGIRAFLETVKLQPCSGKRRLLYSVVKDKQYQAAIDSLAASGLFDVIGIVELKSLRALPIDTLKDTFGQYTGFECRAYRDLSAALDEIVFGRNSGDCVYIVGSLYLVGEVKALLAGKAEGACAV